MKTLRTFIALELPEDLKEKLSQIQQIFIQNTGGIRWVKPENIHLTLKFLGSTSEDKVEEVFRILEQTVRGFPCFAFTVSGLGAFPNPRNPKVIWAGIQANSQLFSFQKQLEDGLSSIGFSREKRSFSPHLTLGRVKDPQVRKNLRDILEKYIDEDWGNYEASWIIFYRSDLKPAGPVYSILKKIEL
jgi:2'-5' RNA ligase